jgi:hypothetical protein
VHCAVVYSWSGVCVVGGRLIGAVCVCVLERRSWQTYPRATTPPPPPRTPLERVSLIIPSPLCALTRPTFFAAARCWGAGRVGVIDDARGAF